MRFLFATLACAALAVGPGCSSASPLTPLVIPDGCQPLAPDVSCTLPYPSDFFLVPDATLPSGKRVALTGAAKPVAPNGADFDVTASWAADGASRQPTIVAAVPGEIVGDGLPNIVDDPARSMDATASPTLLLCADTGELVAHYADIDMRPTDSAKVTIQIRPFVQLAPKTRYVVAVRDLRTASGAAPPAEGFRRLRDKQTSADPALAALAARFDRDVFAPLDKKGVARKGLQLAWDFTTGSAERPVADMLRVRELTLEWLKTHAPAVTVTSSLPDAGTGEYWRVVRGTLQAPLFLDKPGIGAHLFRDQTGAVAQNGEATFPFVVLVPATVRDQWEPGRALAFGHGFFGTMEETTGAPARKLLPALHAVTFAIDWWGMSEPDREQVINDITQRPSHIADFVERTHQAMANWLVTTAAIRSTMQQQDDLKRPQSGPGTSTNGQGMSNAGALLYDPAHVYYFGASNGHILGGVMSALNPDVERAVLNVGGAAWTHMMPRALPFLSFQFLLLSTLRDSVGFQTAIAMIAAPFDRTDPASYASFLIGAKLPGNPDRRVLLQTGLGDASVPNAGGFFHARTLGLSQVGPTPQAVFGIPTADASTLTSAYTLFDFGIDTSTYRDPAPIADNRVHNSLRSDPQAMAQMDAFLRPDGTIIQPCGGMPCKVK